MPRINVPSRSRVPGRALQSSPWSALPPPVVRIPRASTPIPTPPTARQPPPQETTGSIASRPAPAAASRRSRCRRRAGPPPSPPTAARQRRARLGRLSARHVSPTSPDRCAARRARRAGRALDLGRRLAGDRRLTAKPLRRIARKHGVPASAIMQTNGFSDARRDQAGPARWSFRATSRPARRRSSRVDNAADALKTFTSSSPARA